MKMISMKVPDEWLAKVDAAAKDAGMSRTAFCVASIEAQLADPVYTADSPAKPVYTDSKKPVSKPSPSLAVRTVPVRQCPTHPKAKLMPGRVKGRLHCSAPGCAFTTHG